jgi:hypothetical protein
MGSHLGAQMFAPFYALSTFFLTAANLQTDVFRLMNMESGSKNEHVGLILKTRKSLQRYIHFLSKKHKQMNWRII